MTTQSFKRSLTFLHAPESLELVRTAVRAWVRLIERTTGEGSEARFEQLCSLLGDSIIGNIWVYASREPETLQASIDVIPDVVELLGIGSSRYLKVSDCRLQQFSVYRSQYTRDWCLN